MPAKSPAEAGCGPRDPWKTRPLSPKRSSEIPWTRSSILICARCYGEPQRHTTVTGAGLMGPRRQAPAGPRPAATSLWGLKFLPGRAGRSGAPLRPRVCAAGRTNATFGPLDGAGGTAQGDAAAATRQICPSKKEIPEHPRPDARMPRERDGGVIEGTPPSFERQIRKPSAPCDGCRPISGRRPWCSPRACRASGRYRCRAPHPSARSRRTYGPPTRACPSARRRRPS